MNVLLTWGLVGGKMVALQWKIRSNEKSSYWWKPFLIYFLSPDELKSSLTIFSCFLMFLFIRFFYPFDVDVVHLVIAILQMNSPLGKDDACRIFMPKSAALPSVVCCWQRTVALQDLVLLRSFCSIWMPHNLQEEQACRNHKVLFV